MKFYLSIENYDAAHITEGGKIGLDLDSSDIIVDKNSHLMGAIGIAILSSKQKSDKIYNLDIKDIKFETKAQECGGCANNCEILRIFKNNKLIDAWGNRCNKYVKI